MPLGASIKPSNRICDAAIMVVEDVLSMRNALRQEKSKLKICKIR
jgi:hypothetical protein